jgi:hypothetical protein
MRACNFTSGLLIFEFDRVEFWGSKSTTWIEIDQTDRMYKNHVPNSSRSERAMGFAFGEGAEGGLSYLTGMWGIAAGGYLDVTGATTQKREAA